jgi:hypothetical protein
MIMILPLEFLELVLCVQVPQLPRRHTPCTRPPQRRQALVQGCGRLGLALLPMTPSPRHRPRRPMPLPLCIPHRSLPAAPRRPRVLPILLPPAARTQVVASGTGSTTDTRPIVIQPVTNVHSMCTRGKAGIPTSTLCSCRLFLALFVMLCQNPIGAPLCRLSMTLSL